MNSEQQQRIKQILEQRAWRRQHAERFKINALIAANDDLDFLLSIVEEQEAECGTFAVDERLKTREMTVEAVRERRATLYKGLDYRGDPFVAAAMKTDLDYILSLQESHQEEFDKEFSRWQEGIRNKLIDLGAPDWKIDGAGCDSGDPLDFTLAEVGQGCGWFIDKAENAAEQMRVVYVEKVRARAREHRKTAEAISYGTDVDVPVTAEQHGKLADELDATADALKLVTLPEQEK